MARGWRSRSIRSSSHHPCIDSAVSLDLLDVVHQAVQLPLCVDLAPTSQREAPESFRVPDVPEHRLDETKTPTVLVATDVAVDLALHLVEILLWLPGYEP